MIDDLFELARIDAGALRLERRPVAIQEIAAETVDAMQARARNSGILLMFDAPKLPPISVDGARIERALANLIQNALDHTEPGGRIDVRLLGTNGCVEVRVIDTGPGITPEDLPRVWNRFYRLDRARTRNGDGAGLGLAIARAIVEAHGGSVDVQSSPGAGATFALRLPVTHS
jgi:two-component system sensor histidine kinase BaeS